MKTLNFYETPAVEVVELKLQGFLCESTGGSTDPNTEVEPIVIPEEED